MTGQRYEIIILPTNFSVKKYRILPNSYFVFYFGTIFACLLILHFLSDLCLYNFLASSSVYKKIAFFIPCIALPNYCFSIIVKAVSEKVRDICMLKSDKIVFFSSSKDLYDCLSNNKNLIVFPNCKWRMPKTGFCH